MAKITKDLPKTTQFLIAVDKDTEQVYILHRYFPSCLIWVKQETPIRFIIMDWYEEGEPDLDAILQMPFVQQAKDFFFEQYNDSIDLN